MTAARAIEWRLNDDSRWEAVDAAEAVVEFARQMREMTARNRETIRLSRELAASVRARLHALIAWRALRGRYTIQ